MKIKTLLFIVNDQGSWIDRDKDLLAVDFDVAEVVLPPKKYAYFNWALISQVFKADALFFWFGSLQFLPLAIFGRLLGKKVIIVAGGYDVARADLIHHGAFCESPLRQKLRKLLFKVANKVIAVSKANYQEAVRNACIPEKKLELVYLGFESTQEKLIPWSERPKKVVMLATANQSTFQLKGIEHFIEVARMTPDHEFVLMGSYDSCLVEYLAEKPVANLRVTGFVPFGSEAFKKELQTSRFVLQLSYYESFGAAVVDAGLYGCYPVAFSQYALVEVVEGIGRCFPFGERKAVSNFLQEAAAKMTIDAQDIRAAYQARFPMSRRRELLIKAVESVA